MGAKTEIYVDPAIAANSGSGTIGDPYGDLQYALNTATRDSTNGNRINVKAGTAELLTAALSYTTWGASSTDAPTVIQGYTSAAGDGGVAEIDMQGNNARISNSAAYVSFVDLELHNCGTETALYVGAYGTAKRCTVHTATNGIRLEGTGAVATACHIYNISDTGIVISGGGTADNNFLDGVSGASAFVRAIRAFSTPGPRIFRNIVHVDGSSNGIDIDLSSGYLALVAHNTVRGGGSTGYGIRLAGSADQLGSRVLNNLVTRFSGSGGIGIYLPSSSYDMQQIEGNAVWNCATNYSLADVIIEAEDNEDLGTDAGNNPLAESGSATYANRFVYFAPADVGNVLGGAYLLQA